MPIQKNPVALNTAFQKAYEKRRHTSDIPLLEGQREKSYTLFTTTGIPTQKKEAYRYTPLIPTLTPLFLDHLTPPAPRTSPTLVTKNLLHPTESHTLTFVNGYLTGNQKHWPFYCQPLNKAYEKFKKVIDTHFNAQAYTHHDPMANLNTACHTRSYLLYIPPKTKLSHPIILDHHITHHTPATIHPRLLIILGAHARATLIETFSTPHLSPPSLVNQVNEITLEKESQLTHYPLHILHSPTHQLRHTYINQKEKSKFNQYLIVSATNDALLREHNHITLSGIGAENNVQGLYRTTHQKHLAIHTTTTHLANHTTTTQHYQGTAQENASTLFHGQIDIPPGQHNITASQHHKGWILSPTASIHTRPQLAIESDDVQCSHGATTTQIDPQTLTYMQTRGIPAPQAKKMLLHAFFEAAINKLPNPNVQRLVHQALLPTNNRITS